MARFYEMTPDQFRARYEALKRSANQRGTARTDLSAPVYSLPVASSRQETLPGGGLMAFRLARGDFLRLATLTGRASISALLWNARDVSERLNVGDSMKIQWRANLGRGHLIYSDMGRALASIVDDSGAGHDALIGCSDPASTLARYGRSDLPNGRDNLRVAAARIGLERRDVMPCINFFAPIRVDEKGAFHWRDPGPAPGSFLVLRAEMELLVALSNTPHPLDPHPSYAPEPIETLVWPGPEPAADDLCRMGSEEARRAFENADDPR